jgi:hypothetical protein
LLNPKHIYHSYHNGACHRWGRAYYGTTYAGLVQLPLVIAEVEYGFLRAHVKLTTRPAPVLEELVGVSERLLLESSV